jgi:hypothetical protein
MCNLEHSGNVTVYIATCFEQVGTQMVHKIIVATYLSTLQCYMFRPYGATFREFVQKLRANIRVCVMVLHFHSYGPPYRYINGTETVGHYEKPTWTLNILIKYFVTGHVTWGLLFTNL